MVSVADSVVRQLNDLAQHPETPGDHGEALMTAVARVLPFDGYALIGLDPNSGLRSFMLSRDGVGPSTALAFNELRQHDLNRYVDLAVCSMPAGVLDAADRVHARSPRLRSILRPAGYTSELRLVLRAYGRVWGALVLFRSENRRAFTMVDAGRAAALGDALAFAVRRFCVRPSPAARIPLPGGAMILAENDTATVTGASFERWLEELVAGGHDDVTTRDALRVVFDAAGAARSRGSGVVVCIRTMSGRWASLHAEPLDRAPGEVTVTMSQAGLSEVLPSFALWQGLTHRETQVLRVLCAGRSTRGIAEDLDVSVYTAEDHLRSIYRKTSCDGREPLVAALVGG